VFVGYGGGLAIGAAVLRGAYRARSARRTRPDRPPTGLALDPRSEEA